MNRDFDIIRKNAKVDKCTIHDFRRSAITNWTQRLSFQVVHKLAGHSNIKTTMDYYLAVRAGINCKLTNS
ncbi:MAG: tyrosine-type recombinase/integrase [Sedimentisphaeraceae bacterium JB056]